MSRGVVTSAEVARYARFASVIYLRYDMPCGTIYFAAAKCFGEFPPCGNFPIKITFATGEHIV